MLPGEVLDLWSQIQFTPWFSESCLSDSGGGAGPSPVCSHLGVCQKLVPEMAGTLANGNKDESTCGPIPGGLILTHTSHTHFCVDLDDARDPAAAFACRLR